MKLFPLLYSLDAIFGAISSSKTQNTIENNFEKRLAIARKKNQIKRDQSSFPVIDFRFYRICRFYRITRKLKNPKCYPHWEVNPGT